MGRSSYAQRLALVNFSITKLGLRKSNIYKIIQQSNTIKPIRTTRANSRSVSRSSKMLLAFVVMSRTYNFSSGWYTYRTLSVSTNVCCLPEPPMSFGNDASNPSIRDLVISTNWREISAEKSPFCVKMKCTRTQEWIVNARKLQAATKNVVKACQSEQV